MKALAEFPGAVVLITHDPHMIALVADRLWLVADGTVRPFTGDLDEYRALILARGRSGEREEAPQSRRNERRERAESRAGLAPLRRQAREAEATLARLGAERTALERKLANPALYAQGNGAGIAAANSRLAAIEKEVAAAEAIWLEAETRLQS